MKSFESEEINFYAIQSGASGVLVRWGCYKILKMRCAWDEAISGVLNTLNLRKFSIWKSNERTRIAWIESRSDKGMSKKISGIKMASDLTYWSDMHESCFAVIGYIQFDRSYTHPTSHSTALPKIRLDESTRTDKIATISQRKLYSSTVLLSIP